jgi:hypothetical protein
VKSTDVTEQTAAQHVLARESWAYTSSSVYTDHADIAEQQQAREQSLAKRHEELMVKQQDLDEQQQALLIKEQHLHRQEQALQNSWALLSMNTLFDIGQSTTRPFCGEIVECSPYPTSTKSSPPRFPPITLEVAMPDARVTFEGSAHKQADSQFSSLPIRSKFLEMHDDSADLASLLCFLGGEDIPLLVLERASQPLATWDRNGETIEKPPLWVPGDTNSAVTVLEGLGLVVPGKECQFGVGGSSSLSLTSEAMGYLLDSTIDRTTWKIRAISVICHTFPADNYLEPL